MEYPHEFLKFYPQNKEGMDTPGCQSFALITRSIHLEIYQNNNIVTVTRILFHIWI